MIEFDEDTALAEIEMTPENYERLEKMAAAENKSVEEYITKLAEKAVSEDEGATEQIELDLPEDLYNDLSILAVVRGVSFERLIVDSLDEYIQNAAYQLAEEVYKYFTDKYKKEE